MRTLLIDNFDSYTYNLYQLFSRVDGHEPLVVESDALGRGEIELAAFDAIVISPGPGTPERPELADFREVIRSAAAPVLGVCLGHQAIGLVWGARVLQADEIVHGGVSRVRHDASGLFAGIPDRFRAVRYHSLALTDLPEELIASAWSDDGALMALRHRELPQWGVQFHPESIASEHGEAIARNFLRLARQAREATPPARPRPRQGRIASRAVQTGSSLRARRLEWLCEAEEAFVGLFGSAPYSFWLDSAMTGASTGRFSFMGDASGPHASTLTYDLTARRLNRRDSSGRDEELSDSVFDYLEHELARLRVEAPELPFDLSGGFVGYFGYELKAETGGESAHRSTCPDAAFLFADRFLAFDHAERALALVELTDSPGDESDWLDRTEASLRALPAEPPRDHGARVTPGQSWDLDADAYADAIAQCRRQLELGESYEICLTTQIRSSSRAEPLEIYRALRALNPAPYAAFFRFGDLAVCSASPECFLKLGRDRRLETRPIKGTAARASDPAAEELVASTLRGSAKTTTENLMIADLMRNDLGRVCEIGSIAVPLLMAIETYATVHQLVTTVSGTLRPELSAIDVLRAAFPPGSMTGAPKIRTMQIIDSLEPRTRGVYSGSLGYLSLNGCADMSVVIRTIVCSNGELSIGSGGAITILSDPADELAELELEARTALEATAAS
jgi:para-aminobenzoate synthetase